MHYKRRIVMRYDNVIERYEYLGLPITLQCYNKILTLTHITVYVYNDRESATQII